MKSIFILTAVLIGSYINKKGTTVFRYAVTGKQDALDAYEEVQGDNHRVDEKTGQVLYFTSNFGGDRCEVIVNTETNKAYVDMSEFHKINSLTKQFGGQFGEQIAKHAVSRLLGRKATASEEVAEDAKVVS